MRCVNKVALIGNATRNAELRHTSTGKPVSNLRLATNRVSNWQVTTQFHTVICWDKPAEITSQYVKKGKPLYVEGRLEYRTFEDGDGVERGTVEIVANDGQFLCRRRGRAEPDTPRDRRAPRMTSLQTTCPSNVQYQVAAHSVLIFVSAACSGRRQGARVNIAQALLNDPRLLIVDEPTAGLDPEERIRFRNLLSDLAGERTVILSTHIVEDIAQTCRNLAILTNGHVLFQGTTADLIDGARGKVWTMTTDGQKPGEDVTVVSMLHLSEGTQYRFVGEPAFGSNAEPVHPSLEDGYLWLMRSTRADVALNASV